MSEVTAAVTPGTLRPRRHVISARRGGDTVLLDAERDRYFTLNEVGGRVWELLVERPRTIDQLLLALEHEYDVSRGTLTGDLGRLVDELLAATLVERSES